MQPQNVKYDITSPDEIDTTTVSSDLQKWLIDHATGCTYLLAHTLAGVVWGRFENGGWQTSHDIFPDHSPVLQTETLLQCCLFGAQTEVLLWRNDEGWHARRITDQVLSEATELEQALDEEQMLWGTASEQQKNGFTLVHDGMEGLRHAVPLSLPTTAFQPAQNQRPLRLLVRHYIGDDEYGVARIVLSRLVDVYIKPQEQQEEQA